MTGYRLSQRAQGDLEEIWDYSEAKWGADQAETYARRFQRAFDLLAVHPERGRSCDHIRSGYSKFAVGSHLLFYRVSDQGVEIVRILHQRMDFDRHL